MKGVLVAVILALAGATLTNAGLAHAGQNNPVLIAKTINGGDRDAQSHVLRIERLDIRVALSGGLAQTTIEATFGNPTSTPLEGDFTLILPAGAVINGYALNIDGRMVDGVLTGKRRAQQVYENRLRAGVDPGLAEMTSDNNFHTRIFPIAPGQGRTIRLSYVNPLDSQGGFSLPLGADKPVGELKITVTAFGAATPPPLTAPQGLALGWGDGMVATGAARNIVLAGGLVVGPWRSTQPLQLSRLSNGEHLFELRLPYEARAAKAHRLRIYWDHSRSRRDDDVAGEIALLKRYIDEVRPKRVEIVSFADDVPRVTVLTPPTGAVLEQALKAASYEGASSLTGLFTAAAGRADTCIFVSDGRMTLGAWTAQPPACRTFTLSSAMEADRGFLSAMAVRSGGTHIDLAAIKPDAALTSLVSAGPPAFELKTNTGQPVEYRLMAAPTGQYWIIGKTPSAASLIFTGAGGASQTFPLSARENSSDAIGALWGRDAAAEVLATYRPDRDEALALARRYNVATGDASFIVLENAGDYVDAGVAPPASAGEGMATAYRAAMRRKKEEDTEAQRERLDEVVEAWNAQKVWWKSPPRKNKRANWRDAGSGAELAAPTAAPPPPPPPAGPIGIEQDRNGNVNEIIVTGTYIRGAAEDVALPMEVTSREELERAGAPTVNFRTSSRATPVLLNGQRVPQGLSGGEIAVEAAGWNPDRPYLKALAAASPEDYWRVYADQDAKSGDTPVFYLDVAESLFRAGRKADAIRVALNAIDLPASDSKTLIILADRLQRYGDLDRAIWLYDRLLFLEDDRPQPRRNLALALIARGDLTRGKAREADYRRALDLLNAIVIHPADGDFDGVEVVALMEINHLIARMKAAGLKQAVVDPRLVALMDVDIRVVLEWNTDATDMDLWVDEPTGERAIYSNPATRLGGRLSNDMTDGYGPEEYLLRRAPSGEYVVRVNVYGTDQLDPNGPTTVHVRLFRGWGRASEKQETFEIELKKEDNGAMLVGRFRVAP